MPPTGRHKRDSDERPIRRRRGPSLQVMSLAGFIGMAVGGCAFALGVVFVFGSGEFGPKPPERTVMTWGLIAGLGGAVLGAAAGVFAAMMLAGDD